jgi:hypothetical protein
MASPLYGGWISFTVHIYKKYDCKLYKITNKKENRKRDFGFDIKYQNDSIDNLKKLPNILITAIDKKYYQYLDFFPDNTKIVIHDPTEIKNKIIADKLKRFQVITIRQTVHDFLKENKIKSTFLYHPFYEYNITYKKEKTPFKSVSISRIDFDKNIDIILKANKSQQLKQQIDIYGSKNGLYIYHHLKNKLHLTLENYHGTFSKSFDELSNILKDAKFVIDMSTIKNDGGGSQYTFLEAIYHDCVLILNSKWVDKIDTQFKHGYNCFTVSNETELIDILNSDKDVSSIIKNSKEMLKNHILSNWNNKDKDIIPTYTAKKIISDDDIKKFDGKFFTEENIIIFKKDIDVYTEDGKLLLKFRKNKIDDKDCKILFNSKGAAASSKRPSASEIKDGENKYKWIESQTTGKKLYVLTNQNKVHSGIIGYYDSTSNFGHHHYKENDVKCRLTSYTSKYFDKFQECLPVFKKIDGIYKDLVPNFYNIQNNAISNIHSDFVIKDTIFTTVTVNKNFRTALHCDVGDLKDGFGNLVVISEGDYEGGYTMFPQYGVGIDCRNGDFLAMDVHQWHCNSEIKGDGTRISFVFYLREKMIKNCPSNEVKKIKSKNTTPKMSAFMLFCKDERENIKKENKKFTSREIMGELALRWNNVKNNDSEKLNYYFSKLNEYIIQEENDNKPVNDIKNKPRTSAFLLFCKDERENIKKENKKFTSREIMGELALRWNNVKNNDSKKLNYYTELSNKL